MENYKTQPNNQCKSYVRSAEGKLMQCTEKGREKIDNGLEAGIHCDSCWERMIIECRSRSW